MNDEDVIKMAYLLKEEEDDELEELLEGMGILFVALLLEMILGIEDDMDDLLSNDYEDVLGITNTLLEKYTTKAPSKRVIQRRLNARTFADNMSKNVVPKLRQAYFDYYDSFNERYGNSGASFNYASKHYKKIDKWLKGLPKLMKLTTDNQVVDLIRKSYEEGKGVNWLESQLANLNAFTRYRARMTAITENLRMYSAAEYQSYLDNDEIINRTWHHTHGIREPREVHVQADGYTVAKDEPFIINGYKCYYPRDPDLPPEESIHCHCFTVPGFRID